MDDQLVLLYDRRVEKQYYYKVLSSNSLIRLKPNQEDIDQLLVEPYTVQSSTDVCSQFHPDLVSLVTVRVSIIPDNVRPTPPSSVQAKSICYESVNETLHAVNQTLSLMEAKKNCLEFNKVLCEPK